jgi:hypothetical protein
MRTPGEHRDGNCGKITDIEKPKVHVGARNPGDESQALMCATVST